MFSIKSSFNIVTLYCLSYLYQDVCNLISCWKADYFPVFIPYVCQDKAESNQSKASISKWPTIMGNNPWTILGTKILTACACDKDVNKGKKMALI